MIDNPFSVERKPSKAYATYVKPSDGSEHRILKALDNDNWLVAIRYPCDVDYDVKRMYSDYPPQELYIIASTVE